MDKPNRGTKTAAELRRRAPADMRGTLILDEAGPRLRTLAEELDARADAVERPTR